MSTESLNRTSNNNIETPSINLDVLKQKKETQISKKKVCVNRLNHRLHISQKKDKFRNTLIIFSIFLTIGVLGFIIT
tara:strand:+ start:310 stop:540 length:231 start_codon:yes stop_codon:yes gene_type:complete